MLIKQLEELNEQAEHQTSLAGYTVKDQAIDNMKLRLQAMLDDCEQLSNKLQSHDKLCTDVQAEQVSTIQIRIY